jgi:16S rRNA (adenine1518-N6/adenine1519-N6)-dimethyltransferase
VVARKRFGQHFLEPAWVAKVIDVLALDADDVCFEIGPGQGALTRELAARCRNVVAFEIDRDLAARLRNTGPANLVVVEGDFVTSTWILSHRPTRAVRVVGNLPYNAASPILFRLIELVDAGVPIVDATVMLQREVADRLVARPGSREYGVLSVMIQHSADVQRLLSLPPGAFRPVPKVHSALVRLRFHGREPAPRDPQVFADLVRAVFSRRRKTLANALLAYPAKKGPGFPSRALAAAGLDGGRRPETLGIPEFVRLADAVAELPTGGPAVLP